MTNTATTKVQAGEYRTADGYTVSRSWESDGARRGVEWHLFTPAGDYCNTFPTKAAAVAAAARIAA